MGLKEKMLMFSLIQSSRLFFLQVTQVFTVPYLKYFQTIIPLTCTVDTSRVPP